MDLCVPFVFITQLAAHVSAGTIMHEAGGSDGRLLSVGDVNVFICVI